MKMTLRICANDSATIQKVLKALSEETLESNCCGCLPGGGDFDYDFVDSDDLYSDDRNKPIIEPNRHSEKEHS